MRTKTLLATSLAALLLTACSNDEQNSLPQGQGKVVHFVVNGISTRTITGNDYTTQFETGDKIGIYATGSAKATNVPFTVQADATLASETPISYSGTDKANFYAYYPYAEQKNNQQVVFTTPADQSNEKSFNGADFMTAVNSDVESNIEEVELNFRHRMALVQVEVKKEADIPTPDAISLWAAPTLTWNLADGACTTQGETTEIVMWKQSQTNDGSIFWGLVPKQTIATESKLLSIRCGEKSYKFVTENSIALKSNSVKKFNIKISNDGTLVVISNGIQCAKWEENSEEMEGEATPIEP